MLPASVCEQRRMIDVTAPTLSVRRQGELLGANHSSQTGPALTCRACTKKWHGSESVRSARDAILTEQDVKGRERDGRLVSDVRDPADKCKRVVFVRNDQAGIDGHINPVDYILFGMMLVLPHHGLNCVFGMDAFGLVSLPRPCWQRKRC